MLFCDGLYVSAKTNKIGDDMERINELLIKDKFSNLDQVAEILKEEVTPLARNFFLLAEEPVVRFRREKCNFVFNIEIEVSRIKPFGSKLV